MDTFLKDRGFIYLVGFFIVTSLLLWLFAKQLTEFDIDTTVVLSGNLILFSSTFMTYRIYSRQIKGKTGHGVVRNVYAGFVLKFFILATTAMVYFYFAKQINLRGVMVCLILYLIYNFISTLFASANKEQHAPPAAHAKHKHQ